MGYSEFEKLCEEKGVKPADVSRETGISKAALSAWKQGKINLKLERLIKIANYLGVPVGVLQEAKERAAVFGLRSDTGIDEREYLVSLTKEDLTSLVEKITKDVNSGNSQSPCDERFEILIETCKKADDAQLKRIEKYAELVIKGEF